ncbi:DUF2842 domain-containing protein [Aliiroseovarius subalbicans]|uniref:DUF2842 domain-containing protein n=1 Tax=Aliiroseovarius subalbicans TaxID=2925840 RepID=UPI001F5984B4|nr:DUF2842 domain-containing protein [Aliiroseovarius subalbicans]MCI2397908.1 DUF2842 domain-containing protein [Aliiroseovarius subalbicans]
MALSYKARKRWSLVILVIGLPIYIILAVGIVALFERPPILVELGIYVGLGFLWIMPFKKVFIGVGKPDPDADPRSYPHDPAGKYGLDDDS